MKLVENLTAYAETSSIHGINYIAKTSSSKVVRLTWVFLFVAMLTYAANMISYEAKEWREKPTITKVETLSHPIDEVTFPAVTICSQNSNSDRWGSTIKVLDYLKGQCEANEECTHNQVMYQKLAEKVDNLAYNTALDMAKTLYKKCNEKIAWDPVNVQNYIECTWNISQSSQKIQDSMANIQKFTANLNVNTSVQIRFAQILQEVDMDLKAAKGLEKVLSYIKNVSSASDQSLSCESKNCLEGTRELVIRLKMIEWGIFGLGAASSGSFLAYHHQMLGPYFGDIDGNEWPRIPLHKEPTELEKDFNQLLTNITFAMSNESLRNISLLDLPGFGATIGTLKQGLKKQFNWPIKLNFASLGINQPVNKTKISISYKTLNEDWATYMKRLNEKDYDSYFTSQMKNNEYLNFTRFINADLKSFLVAISGSFPSASKYTLPIWAKSANSTFTNTRDENFVKRFGLYDKSIIDCAFRENLRLKKIPDSSGGCKGFQPSLTTNGMCYTFNGQHTSEIWKDSKVMSTFQELFPSQSASNKTFGGSRSVQGLQLWTNMKPYSNQLYGPTSLQYTIGVTGKNTFFEQKISVHKLRPGYHTTVFVVPKLLETTSEFKSLKLQHRRCKLTHESNGLELFKKYTRKGCELECAAKKAAKVCKCLPWQYPNNFTTFPMCDMFGGYCFDKIISNEVFYKKCKSQCLENCDETSLSIWQKSVPFEIEGLCKKGAFFDNFFFQNFHRIFAFENYRILVEEKRIPHLAASFANGSLCTNYVRKYVSFLTVESPSESVSKSSLDRRTSIDDQIGVIGGTLGICIGTSILSFGEIILCIYIICKSIGQDVKTLWIKMKRFLQILFSDDCDGAQIKSVVVVSKNQICIDQDELNENKDDIEKLYVSSDRVFSKKIECNPKNIFPLRKLLFPEICDDVRKVEKTEFCGHVCEKSNM